MMKKLLFVLIGIIAINSVNAQLSDLIISEYIEGGSFNKAVEIYNGTGQSVDLSTYSLKASFNGGADWSQTLQLEGTLENDNVYVVSRSDADAAITAEMDLTNSSVINFNGDDALALFNGEELIDIFGVLGEDPGSAWDVAGVSGATKDHTLVRKASVSGPNTDWSASAGTNTEDSEWMVYDKDDFSFIGSHDASNEPSSATAISSFVVEDQVGESVIDAETHTVIFEMAVGTDVSALVPTIVVSSGASINPQSGIAQDFTSDVVYTVTAEDETTTQDWTVSVAFNADVTLLSEGFETLTPNEDIALDGWNNFIEAGTKKWIGKAYSNNQYAQFSSYNSDEANTAWLIAPTVVLENTTENTLSFDVNIGYFTHEGLQVLITNEYNAEFPNEVTSLTWTDVTDQFTIPTEPTNGYGTFASAGALVLDTFSDDSITVAFKYTGDDTNSETTTYQIDNVVIIGQANLEPSSETDILAFVLEDQTADADINTETHAVNIEVVFGTDVTNLTPVVQVSNGATYSPEGAQNFTNAVVYTVTAEDEESTQDWTVTVTIAEELSHDAEILNVVFDEEIAPAVINSEAATVNAIVAWDTDLTELTPEITVSVGAQITPTVAQDFSTPVVYTVTAQDGETTKDWTFTVTKDDAPSAEAEILTFELDALVEEVIIDSELATVTGKVAYGTDVTALSPTITVSEGATLTPDSGTEQDFSAFVLYVVTAENGTSEKYWIVELTVEEPALTTIYDIQYTTEGPSTFEDQEVITKGVVAAVDAKGIYLQDGAGAWNGIYVYEGTAPAAVVGDSLLVSGKVVEYNNLTEISNPAYTVLNSGNTVTGAVVVSSIADFQDEMFEGVMVTLSGLTCSEELDSYNNWKVVDANEDTLIVRNNIVDYTPALGSYFESITGFGGQYGENYQLYPRSLEDIVLTLVNDQLSEITINPNPATAFIHIQNTENVYQLRVSNIIGKTIWSAESNGLSHIRINVSEFEKGIYIITLATKTGLIRSERIVVE